MVNVPVVPLADGGDDSYYATKVILVLAIRRQVALAGKELDPALTYKLARRTEDVLDAGW
jgi:hypothetical protein